MDFRFFLKSTSGPPARTDRRTFSTGELAAAFVAECQKLRKATYALTSLQLGGARFTREQQAALRTCFPQLQLAD
jgi:hypothetical protein